MLLTDGDVTNMQKYQQHTFCQQHGGNGGKVFTNKINEQDLITRLTRRCLSLRLIVD